MFTLNLTAEEVSLVGKALVKRPFEEVVELINKMNAQLNEQQTPPMEPSVPPEVPPNV